MSDEEVEHCPKCHSIISWCLCDDGDWCEDCENDIEDCECLSDWDYWPDENS